MMQVMGCSKHCSVSFTDTGVHIEYQDMMRVMGRGKHYSVSSTATAVLTGVAGTVKTVNSNHLIEVIVWRSIDHHQTGDIDPRRSRCWHPFGRPLLEQLVSLWRPDVPNILKGLWQTKRTLKTSVLCLQCSHSRPSCFSCELLCIKRFTYLAPNVVADRGNSGTTTSKSGLALNRTSYYGKLKTARNGGIWL